MTIILIVIAIIAALGMVIALIWRDSLEAFLYAVCCAACLIGAAFNIIGDFVP